MSSSSAKATGLDSNAIYYEVSPTIILCMRVYNVVCLIMVLVAFVLCLIKGQEHNRDYLLACNLVFSGLISIVINWWYRKAALAADKYWYIFLVSTVIIFQAITTDIYVFHEVPSPTPSPPPVTKITPYTGTTVTWLTINTKTISPPPSFAPFKWRFLLHDNYLLRDELRFFVVVVAAAVLFLEKGVFGSENKKERTGRNVTLCTVFCIMLQLQWLQ